MRQLKRKIMLGIFASVCLIASLSTTTYAWFKLHSEAWVSPYDMNMSMDSGILVSVDGKNFTNTISTDLLTKAIVAKQNGFTIKNNELYDGSGKKVTTEDYEDYATKISLAEVTSINGRDFFNEYLYLDGYTGNTKVTLEDGKYVSFDLYFTCYSSGGDDSIVSDANIRFLTQSIKDKHSDLTATPTSITGTDVDISIFNALTVLENGVAKELTPKTGEDTKIKVNAGNAIRLSVTKYEMIENVLTPITNIYEPNLGYGSYATDISDGDTGYNAIYDSTKNAAFTYYNSIHQDYGEMEEGYNDHSKTPMPYSEMPKTYTSFDDEVGSIIETLKYNTEEKDFETKKVTFALWVEGYDADCLDGMGLSDLNLELSFTLYDNLER